MNEEHRCEFTPADLVPDIGLRVHNPLIGKQSDQLGIADVTALQFGLEDAFDAILPFLFQHGQGDIVPYVRNYVGNLATIHADEASSWDGLHAGWQTWRINHSLAYSADGACTNQAESYFSRLRRMEVGTHHHIAGAYLYAYAGEAAWREDNRRVDNGAQAMKLVHGAMASRQSRTWAGYWQRAA